jgi:hypothetical protein
MNKRERVSPTANILKFNNTMKDTITNRELNNCIRNANELENYDDANLLARISVENELTETGYLLTEDQQFLVDFYI